MLWLIKRNKVSLKPNHFKLITLRSLFGLSGVACYFYAITNLKLADAVILNKTSPFFVMVLSVIFLHEKVNRKQLIALAVALLGVLFVVKPQMDLSILPALIGLMAAFFAGTAYTIIRNLRLYDDSRIIVFYFCLFSVVLMIPLMLFGQFVVPQGKDIFNLLMIGVMATTAQFLMTNGYRHAPASELAVYSYANILFSILLGMLIWLEIPDVFSIIGATLVVTGGVMNYFAVNRSRVGERSSENRER